MPQSDTATLNCKSSVLGLPVFLTAYDPSDLPGGSVDPLGFERGYLFLADKFLPGLTNVAERPRYFSVLCAGAFLANIQAADSARIQYQRRLDCLLRLERFWALANVLASEEQASDDKMPISGIRGVTYATQRAESLLRTASRRVSADFKLLSRQVPYGVVGIYGAVADGMQLLDRKTLTLTPDLGERLAEGFLVATEAPNELRKAVVEDGDVPVSKLIEWGYRAHIASGCSPVERHCFNDVLHRNSVRSRMADILLNHPFQADGESELQRLKRLMPVLASEPTNLDLHEAVSTVLAYEAGYQLVTLGFERLLWLCRSVPSASIRPTDLNSDDVLKSVCEDLPSAARKFGRLLDSAQTEQFRLDLQRLDDTRRFLDSAAAACSSPESLSLEILGRHGDIQRGKLDRGRRKMPWLELSSGRISLTMTRVGGLDREATQSSAIAPHPYRLSSADALIAAAGKA